MQKVRGLVQFLGLLFVILLSIASNNARAQVESPYSTPLGIGMESYP